MDRVTAKTLISALACALFLAAALVKPVYASESGNAVQQTQAAQETAEPDPSIPLKVTAIDFGWEGWGDGTMIESKGECMLMDTFMPDCEDALKEFLLDNGYTEFSLYLSHFHADHFGNMRNIMWDDRFKVKAVYMPDDAYMWATDNDYADLLGWFHSMDVAIKELAAEKGIPLIILRPGDSFRVGDAKVEILYGTTYESDDHDREYLNNNSLVFGFFNSTDDDPDSFANGWVSTPVSNLMEFANVYSSRYNGNVTFKARDGVITVRAERNRTPKIVTYRGEDGIGLSMTYQQFNNRQEPKDTDKMKAAGAAAAVRRGLLPAVYK